MADGGLAAIGTSSRAALRYRVEGMDCPGCAGKIETAVGRVQGAGEVRVNYQRQVLAFQLDETLTPRAEVEGRIRKLGYGVAPVAAPEIVASDGRAAEPTPDIGSGQPWWQGRKARLAGAIGALLAVGFAVSTVSTIDHWAYLPAALLGLWFFGRKALAAARAGSPFSMGPSQDWGS